MTIEEMRTALHSFDDSGLKPLLDKLELRRNSAFKTFLGVVFILGFVVAYLLLEQGLTDVSKIAGGVSVMISIFFFRRMAVVRKEAKERLMPALCDQIGLDYNLSPFDSAIIPFKNVSIIPSHDEARLEDQITGEAEGIDFKLLEAKLITITRDSKGRTSRKTVFNGFLVEFDFHKEFNGETVITKDHTMIGNFFSGFGKTGNRVKLEDPEFERQFEVHSTDQVEARYLLTPRFMERVVDFSKLPRVRQVQLAFNNGRIYMAIKRKGNAFEGGSFKLNDPELIKQNINDIAMIFDVVTELNLTQETKI
ncbi:MAG: DUF3137 domain-containing protein [Emcibacteraceae bacterium]|nr:DUF3137 domain-containing protein [Emcibacteraceae bacterium]